MSSKIIKVSSGIKDLDKLLGGGVFIGDNVVWYDDVGSLAMVFCLNFIRATQQEHKPLIYLSFDRSMKTLMDLLGPLAANPCLTVLDCFTHGKGEDADVFNRFYQKASPDFFCQVIKVDEPRNADHVSKIFYDIHNTLTGDVRFVFDSLTGMQELWGGEEQTLKFYAHSCPRLYELNTVAYWIVEKKAHSQRLKAHINKIAQVAIDLSLRRGKTALTVVKADKRKFDALNKAHAYWAQRPEYYL
jgi:KaiC/GvpD/RAD55 family RecA-like ATPase